MRVIGILLLTVASGAVMGQVHKRVAPDGTVIPG
jgi:hypothetical protein